MSALPSENLFDVWDTYKKVVTSNCMYHIEIGAQLNLILKTHCRDKKIALLDLGCGDAATFTPLITGVKIGCYRGVDLSRTALNLAEQNLQGLNCPVELIEGDILDTLKTPATYDVIYSSFALHHLVTAQKAEFFQRAKHVLNPEGLLAVVDVVREEEEALDVYLSRYTNWLKESWLGLEIYEREAVAAHVLENDLPETASTLLMQAQQAGLRLVGEGAKYGWHRLMCFMPISNI